MSEDVSVLEHEKRLVIHSVSGMPASNWLDGGSFERGRMEERKTMRCMVVIIQAQLWTIYN